MKSNTVAFHFLFVLTLFWGTSMFSQTTISVNGTNTWSEYGSNPLFGGTSSNKAYYPVVLKVSSTYHIWYGDGSNTRHASSTNSDFNDVTFPATQCTGLTTGAYHPRVLYDASGWTIGGTSYAGPYLMYYTTGSAWTASPRVAHSSDGDSWTEIGSCTGVNSYSTNSTIYNFDVLYEGGTTWKAYADNGSGHTEYYTSTNGIDWTGTAHNILDVGGSSAQSWETSNTSPHVFKVNNYYVLFYGSGGTYSNQALGMAVSTDGQNFTKSEGNPIFTTSGSPPSWRTSRSYTPYVFQDGSAFKMYYTGKENSTGAYSIGLATNSGLFWLIQDAVNATTTGDIVNIASGTYNETVTTGLDITLNGTGPPSIQNLTVGENITMKGAISISGTLICNTYIFSGNGNFTLGSGATIKIGSTDGITSSGSSGNIQVTGSRSFSTGANYTYNGSAAQVTGNGLPSTVNNFTVSNSEGVTLSNSVAISNAANISGTLSCGTNILSGNGSFTLESGATIKIGSTDGITSSGASGNIQVTGSRSFSTGANYTYNGSSAQVTGSGLPSTVNDITINNSSNVTLGNSPTVEGALTITSGNLDLNGNTITLSSSANLVESSGNTVIGTSGYLTTTRTLNAPSGLDIGGLGSVITTSQNMGSTVVKRGHAAQTGNGNSSIKRYYEITPTNNAGLNATLVFNYDDSELNGLTEANLLLYRSTDGGSNWTQRGGTVDTGNNTISLSGIDAFSSWTGGGSGDQSLPVELINFIARQEQGTVILEWVTESEIENSGFILERREKSGSSSWGEIASYLTDSKLTGQGSVTYRTKYYYKDNTVLSGVTYEYRLGDVSYNSVVEYHTPISVRVKVKDFNFIPEVFTVYQNYPNPFNAQTTISYYLPEEGNVTISFYDLTGREVDKLIQEHRSFGPQKIVWNEGNISSGIYFYRISVEFPGKIENQSLIRKLVVLK